MATEFFEDTLPTDGSAMRAVVDPLGRRRQLERRQRALAQFMRDNAAAPPPQGQMVSGHYIAPGVADYLERPLLAFIGAHQQRELDAQELAAGVAEQAALRDDLTKLSGREGREAIPPNYVMQRPEDQAGVPGVEAVPAATGADRRAVIASLMGNPAGGGLGHQLLRDDLIEAPRRAEAARIREAEAERARIERGEQAAADRLAREERATADAQLRKDLLAQRGLQQITIRGMGGGNGPRDRYSVQQGPDGAMYRVNLETGQAEPITIAGPGGAPLTKPTPPVKLPAAQQKAFDDAEILLGHIGDALQRVKSNPRAVGFKTVVPDIALSKIDPEGVATRAAVAGLAAEKVHQLSGAAVSAAEFARLRPYLPASGDTAEAVERKLEGLKREVERIKAVHARGPTMVGGAPVAPAAPTGSGLPPGWSVQTR